MSERSSSPPRRSHRAPAVPAKIPTGPPLKKFVPYVLAVVALVVLVVLVRIPRLAAIGAFGTGLVIMAALGWIAMGHRIGLAPDDWLRGVVVIVAVATVIAAAVPFGYTLFPPPPQGEVSLSEPGAAGSVQVRGTSASLWLTVTARLVPTATGPANYFLSVTRQGGPTVRVDGTLRPQAGTLAIERRVLDLRGPGTFTVRLEQTSAALALPVRVAVYSRPFSSSMLAMLYAALGVVVVLVDVLLWRRGLEPSYAASLLLPLVAVWYFQRQPVSDSLPMDLLTSGVFGALAGGLGGEILARIGRLLARK